MGWSIGYDSNWNRDIGYGVPAYCDAPGCTKKIDRGLSYVCGARPYGGEKGCGLFFCGEHQFGGWQRCNRCYHRRATPYKAKPDHPQWIRWKLKHESWAKWRAENPEEVKRMQHQSET
jgi:hypothetical protein